MLKTVSALTMACSALALFSVPTFAQDGTSPAEIPESEFTPYTGVYAGTYLCGKGENGMTISIDSVVDLVGVEDGPMAKVDARLWFYDTTGNPDHPKGAFKLTGTLSETELSLSPAGWISDAPSDWGAAGVKGIIILEDDGPDELYGEPTGVGTWSCHEFQLTKLEGL